MRTLILLGATVLFASQSAAAQDPLAAVRKAKKAAAAADAHIAAEQRTDDAPKATSSKPAATGMTKTTQQGVAKAVSGNPAEPAPDTAGPPPTIYRESFEYSADGRRDPFNSLLTTSELRPALSDLLLTGILYDLSGRHSVATLRDLGTKEQYRVTLGSTLGRMRVSAIRYTTVVFTIDEFGTTRQDSLVLRDSTKARGK